MKNTTFFFVCLSAILFGLKLGGLYDINNWLIATPLFIPVVIKLVDLICFLVYIFITENRRAKKIKKDCKKNPLTDECEDDKDKVELYTKIGGSNFKKEKRRIK